MPEHNQPFSKKQITATRLALHRLGYRIIPTYGKIARLKGWHSAEFVARELNEKRITSWERRYPELQSTGVRLDLGLGTIDGDVDNQELAEAAWVAVTIAAPQAASGAPLRYGKSPDKFAMFVRIEGEAFRYMASRSYLRPEALAAWQAAKAAGENVADPPTHKIEIFGGRPSANGNCNRHFGIAGPHSYAEDGTVAATYSWADGPTLETTPLDALPSLTAAQALDIIDRFDAAAIDLGWVALTEPVREGGHSGVAYDITDATRFDTNKGGEQIDYEELCADYALYGSALRCSASFLPGRGREGNRSHCVVGDDNRHGCVAVHVFGDDCTHFPADLAPDRDQKILDSAPMLPPEALADRTEPPEPPEGAELHVKAGWLVDAYAYHAGDDAVVPIYATELGCGLTPSAFHRRFRYMHMPNPDKRFKRAIFATDLWEMTPQRRNIAALRMRPDRPFPLFEENGQLYKNTYCRPRHEGVENSSDLTTPFDAFMERFLPDPVERDWLLDWMAHKQRHPEIPGTSIFFVADDADSVDRGTFGTGRGILSRIVRKLYGEQYCTSQSFSMLDGTSSQSQFNDWLHGSILVTVDEARTSKTAHRRGERNAAFEVLKDIVDPAPKQHSFKGKNRRAFIGMSYCSIWLFTNHGDAAAIPEHDRRFTVLRNGRQLTPEERAEILTWEETPGAIAALSAALATRDLTGFDMQQPLETAGKAEMAELSRSDVEELLRDILEDDGRGLVFTKAHIEAAIGSNYNGQGTYWRGEFSGVWSQYCVGLKGPGGNPRRVRSYGTRKKLFCFRSQHARVRQMPEAAIHREVAKWGGVDPLTGPSGIERVDEND